MLRIVTSLIRNAPGPFRGARALAADLVEGLLDVVSPPPEMPPPPPPAKPAGAEQSPEPVAASTPKRKPEPAPPPSEAKTAPGRDPTATFAKAMTRPDWVRRQDFKVLAIFWEARRRREGPITAKRAARLGEELGLTIRHENVRKVVRTRLTEQVRTETVPNSQPPTFEFELTDEGKRFFEKEFLAKV